MRKIFVIEHSAWCQMKENYWIFLPYQFHWRAHSVGGDASQTIFFFNKLAPILHITVRGQNRIFYRNKRSYTKHIIEIYHTKYIIANLHSKWSNDQVLLSLTKNILQKIFKILYWITDRGLVKITSVRACFWCN